MILFLRADIMTNACKDVCVLCQSDGKCVSSEQKNFISRAEDGSCDILRAKNAPVHFKAALRAKRCASSDAALPIGPEIGAVK